MDGSTLGLLFEISADPSKADAVLARFSAETRALSGAFVPTWETANAAAATTARTMDTVATPAVARTGNQLMQARASAMIFEQQMGIHVPRGINNMLARAELIGPLLRAAFGIGILVMFGDQIGKVADAIASAALRLGGFRKEAQGLLKQEEEFNTWLLSRSKERLEKELKINLDARAKIRGGIADVTAEMKKGEEQGEKQGTAAVAMYKGMSVAAMTHQATVTGLNVKLAGLNDQLAANEAQAEKYNLELAKLQETHEKTAKKAKEHKDKLGEEDTEIERTNRLFRELSVGVLTTDTAYREYLHTLGDINRIYEEHSHQVLVSLNEQRFAQELLERYAKLSKDEAEWRFKGTASLKAESVEIKHLEGTWAEVLARQFKVHASTVDFIRDMNLAGISTKQLREEVVRTFVLGLPSSLNISRKALATWANDVKIHVGMAQAAFVALKDTVREVEAGMSQALGQSIAAAIVYQQSIGAAMAAAVKAEVSAIAGRALVKAIFETAEGIACLATFNFYAAALHFQAAAIYGSIGVAAAAIGRAIPSPAAAGPGEGAAGMRGSAGPQSALAPGAAGGGGAAGPVINVYIDGVISSDNLDQVLQQINERVQGGDVHLISTTTLAPATVRS